MIGTTGSGKTTCILKFLGYNLKKVKCNDLVTLVPVEKVVK
jgi:type II secretory ATPase GspE/PulE/Tfp pilus assembly ATPase PilB-like protein